MDEGQDNETNLCRIRYPDPVIKVNDTVKVDIATGKITDIIKVLFTASSKVTLGLTFCSLILVSLQWPQGVAIWVVSVLLLIVNDTTADLISYTSRMPSTTHLRRESPTCLLLAQKSHGSVYPRARAFRCVPSDIFMVVFH